MEGVSKVILLTTACLVLTVTGTGLEVSEPRTGLPSPWEIDSSVFRPGGTLVVEANVTDGTASEVTLTIEGPSFTDTVGMDEVNDTYTRQYRLPTDVEEGLWTANVTADDVSTTTSFSITGLETTTLQLTRSERSGEEFWIDGAQATDGIYTDPGFPYGIGVADGIMTGLIGYGDVRALGYDSGDPVTFNLTQGMDDAVTLLPLATMDNAELDQLAGQFGQGGSGLNTFLDPGRVAFGYDLGDTTEIQITLSYRDSDSIILRGFNSSLSSGLYELEIENEGSQDGKNIISIQW